MLLYHKDSFSIESDEKVEVEISVDGNYALYINDRFVNSGQYPDYPEYKVYDRLDLSQYVVEGENELMIRVWWPGVDHFSYCAEPAGLIYSVFSDNKILTQSDDHTLVALNTAFQNGMIPNITTQLGFTFIYDARKEGKAQYAPAKVIEKKATLYPRPIKKLKIGERAASKIVNYGTFVERPYEHFGERMLLSRTLNLQKPLCD